MFETLIDRLEPINIDALVARLNHERKINIALTAVGSVIGFLSFVLLDSAAIRGILLLLAIVSSFAVFYLLISKVEKKELVASDIYIANRLSFFTESDPIKSRFNMLYDAQGGFLLKRQVDAMVKRGREERAKLTVAKLIVKGGHAEPV